MDVTVVVVVVVVVVVAVAVGVAVVVAVVVGPVVTGPFTRSSFAISTPDVASTNRTVSFPPGSDGKVRPESEFVRIKPEPV